MKQERGFTLVELLVVIAIISILATVLLINVFGFTCSARQGVSKAAILEMDKALTVYYQDYSCYPDEEEGFSSRTLVFALKGDFKSEPPKKQYYPFKNWEMGSNGEWMSKLSFPYYYRNNFDKNYSAKTPPPGDVRNPYTYDIWSRDCNKKLEGVSSPLEIAVKTKVCNWD